MIQQIRGGQIGESTSQTIRASYFKAGLKNFLEHGGDGFAESGVIEIFVL